MSEPVTALRGASDASGIVEVAEIGPVGMITLRGDLSVKAITKAAAAAGGVTLPEVRHCNTQGERGIAWMSPDELLIMCPYAEVYTRIADLQGKLAKQHALAVNVSDARAVFTVKGPHAREVIAKLAPVDLHSAAFTPGMFRRTRLAQVPAAFWMPEEQCFHIVCFRSVAAYVFDLLKIAAQPGSEVGHIANA
jgi:sarcosine oxidase subunit gamma